MGEMMKTNDYVSWADKRTGQTRYGTVTQVLPDVVRVRPFFGTVLVLDHTEVQVVEL